MKNKEEQTAPKLRFKGYTDAWQQRRLGEISSFSKGMENISKNDLHLSGKYPIIHYADLYKFKPIQSKTLHYTNHITSSPIRKNSLLFPGSDVTSNGLARTSTMEKENVYAGGDVIIATLNSTEVKSKFLTFEINYHKDRIIPLITGTTIRHVHAKELQRLITNYPNLFEQNKIGNLLSKLNETITLLQKELELKIALEQYLRKHLLTILKNNVPILRLKKYKYSWKNKSLDEVTNIKTGSRNHQDSVPNGKYPFFVRSANIEHLNEYDFDEKAILVPGDGKIGEIFHYYEGKFALHQRVYKIDKFKEIDPKFLLNLFKNSFKKHAIRLNAQGTVPSLRLPMFTNWKMYMPTLSEQKQIASILSSVEKSIENDKNKIKSLDALKQFLLQNMFI